MKDNVNSAVELGNRTIPGSFTGAKGVNLEEGVDEREGSSAGDNCNYDQGKATQHTPAPKVATTLDAYFLGFGLVVSGQYYSWNLGLGAYKSLVDDLVL